MAGYPHSHMRSREQDPRSSEKRHAEKRVWEDSFNNFDMGNQDWLVCALKHIHPLLVLTQQKKKSCTCTIIDRHNAAQPRQIKPGRLARGLNQSAVHSTAEDMIP